MTGDIEELNDLTVVQKQHLSVLTAMIDGIAAYMAANPRSAPADIRSNADRIREAACRKCRNFCSKSQLLDTYQILCTRGILKFNSFFELLLTSKGVRSQSGVLPVTIITSPGAPDAQGNMVSNFNCTYDCHFCPNESRELGARVDIARSYLSSEPAVARGLQNDFVTVKMVWARFYDLERLGHSIDKIEIIVLGGTLDCHRPRYLQSFFRDVFYAANMWQYLSPARSGFCSHILGGKRWWNMFDPDGEAEKAVRNIRLPGDIATEQSLNENASCAHVIGIVVETRPDNVNRYTTLQKRKWGSTRCQLGVQHTDSALLDVCDRRHHKEASDAAVQCLADNAFKIDVHLMPDLPGTTPRKDRDMTRNVLAGNTLMPDYVKLYPCLDVPFTRIAKWKREGRWVPLADSRPDKFLELVAWMLATVPPWTRVNRVQRDFPEARDDNDNLGFVSETIKSNLRQMLDSVLESKGVVVRDIRAREVAAAPPSADIIAQSLKLYIRSYRNASGTEYFISFEIPKILLPQKRQHKSAKERKMEQRTGRGTMAPSAEAREVLREEKKLRAANRSVNGSPAQTPPQYTFPSTTPVAEPGNRNEFSAQHLYVPGDAVQPIDAVEPIYRSPAGNPTEADFDWENVADGLSVVDNASLLGLVRVRIPDHAVRAARNGGYSKSENPDAKQSPPEHVIESLTEKPTALVRELHVYGSVTSVAVASIEDDAEEKTKGRVQHGGLGKALMAIAEVVAAACGMSSVAVISGVGVRQFYRKLGYELVDPGAYMMKDIALLVPTTTIPIMGASFKAQDVAYVVRSFSVSRKYVHIPRLNVACPEDDRELPFELLGPLPYLTIPEAEVAVCTPRGLALNDYSLKKIDIDAPSLSGESSFRVLPPPQPSSRFVDLLPSVPSTSVAIAACGSMLALCGVVGTLALRVR